MDVNNSDAGATPPPEIPATFLDRGALRFWTAVLFTGFGAGCGAIALTLVLHLAQYLAWGASNPDALISAARAAPVWRHLVVLVAAGAATVGGRVLLSRITSGGIDLTAAIWFDAGRLPLMRTAASAVLSVVLVGMGTSLGREGGPKQLAAVVADFVANLYALPDAQRRLLVAIGAGAGMSAVYSVPIGGALFAVEVLRGGLTLRLVLPALAASAIAVAVAGWLIPNAPNYHLPPTFISTNVMAGAIFVCPAIGFVSVAFVRAIAWADRARPKGFERTGITLLTFLSLGAVSVWRPEVLGNGQNIVEALLTGPVALPSLLALVILRPFYTVACFATGAPGGLFTPSLAAGALVGAALGSLWLLLFPGGDVAMFALLGAGAMLAATTQGPISALVLMIELTGEARAFALPMVVAVVLATATSRAIEWRSIYEARLSDAEVKARVREREAGGAGSLRASGA